MWFGAILRCEFFTIKCTHASISNYLCKSSISDDLERILLALKLNMVVVLSRKTGPEHLSVLKITRKIGLAWNKRFRFIVLWEVLFHAFVLWLSYRNRENTRRCLSVCVCTWPYPLGTFMSRHVGTSARLANIKLGYSRTSVDVKYLCKKIKTHIDIYFT